MKIEWHSKAEIFHCVHWTTRSGIAGAWPTKSFDRLGRDPSLRSGGQQGVESRALGQQNPLTV